MAVREIELNYPFNVKVIGKTIENIRDLDHYKSKSQTDFKRETEKAFEKWLVLNCIPDKYALAASITHRGSAEYAVRHDELLLFLSFDQASNVLELFEDQTIEFVIGVS